MVRCFKIKKIEEADVKYYKDDIENKKKYSKKYYKENKEKILAKRKIKVK